MHETLLENLQSRITPPQKRATPPVNGGRLDNLPVRGDADAHAEMLSRMSEHGAAAGDHLLLKLQRSHGNRHLQRVVELARRGNGQPRSSAQPTVIQRQEAGPDTEQQEAPVGQGPAKGPSPPTGGCTTKPPAKDPRTIFDNLCLLSTDLKDDPRLNDAFHNNPPLTAKDNGDPVRKMQGALIKVGEVLPKFKADGKWGDETNRAVFSFQSKNRIPPGGFEAGRKTFLALDAHLQQQPGPPSTQDAKLSAACGKDAAGNAIVVVNGSGFPPGPVDLLVDNTPGNSALAGPDKTFVGAVPANLKDGSHTVLAKSGAVSKAAAFSTPCSPSIQPTPTTDPLVTPPENFLSWRSSSLCTKRSATLRKTLSKICSLWTKSSRRCSRS